MNSCLGAAWRTICFEVSHVQEDVMRTTLACNENFVRFNAFVVVAGGSYFQPLSWSLRLKVALGAAKGLAFLHSAEAKVIYRDFKTSNILLDSVTSSFHTNICY